MKSFRIFLSIIIVFSMLAAGGAKAGKASVDIGERKDTGGDLELVARFDSTNLLSMVASGSLVYVGMRFNQANRVAILDCLDPAHPVEIAAIELEGYADDFHPLGVIGEMLYISAREEGIRIYNISTPAAPALVKTFNPLEAFFPGQMVVSGDLAYLADLNGLVILDVSDPTNPAVVGYESNATSIFSLSIQGTNAYALGSDALRAYDISNPARPLLLDEYSMGDSTRRYPTNLAVNGGYAYLTSFDYYMSGNYIYHAELIDISDPADLRKLADLPALAAHTNQLVIAGDLLYAARSGGLAIFDLSDPADPQPIGTYPGISGLAVQPQAGRTAYLDGVTGLQLLDMPDPASPIMLGFYNWPQRSINMEIVGTNLYTVHTYLMNQYYEYKSLLQVIDISDPHQPDVSGQAIIDADDLREIFVDGTTVYLPAGNGLTIVDTANLEDMQTVNLWLGWVNDVEVKQDTAYALSGEWDGTNSRTFFSTINVVDPLAPSMLGELTVEGYPIDLSVAEQGGIRIAYILTGRGWWAVDVSNPAAPLVVYQDQSAQELQRITTETRGDKTIAYLAKAVPEMYNSPDEGLAAIDVSDPTHPLNLGIYSMDVGGTTVLMVEDAMVYYAGETEGDLKLIDFSDPANPTLVAHASVEGASIYDASLTQEYIIAAAYNIVFFAKHSHLEGRVTDHNYQPFPGVSLALSNGDTALSDAEGYFAFPDLEFGAYAITPTLAGYAFSPPNRQVSLPNADQFQNFVILPVPVSTELQPGITTTLTYIDVQGLPTSFTFPAGLVDAPATAVVTPTLEEGFFGMDFAGHAFDLTLQAGGEHVYSTTFPAPVSIAIQYSPMDTAVISDTASLGLYRLEEGIWVEATANCPSQPAPSALAEGAFQGVLCQDGKYALLGPTYSLALPVMPEP